MHTTNFSLIKMLYYMCEKTDLPLTWPQLKHAIKRNFGGLEPDDWNPYDEFTKQIQMGHDLPDLTNIPEEVNIYVCCKVLLAALLITLPWLKA